MVTANGDIKGPSAYQTNEPSSPPFRLARQGAMKGMIFPLAPSELFSGVDCHWPWMPT